MDTYIHFCGTMDSYTTYTLVEPWTVTYTFVESDFSADVIVDASQKVDLFSELFLLLCSRLDERITLFFCDTCNMARS